MNKKFSSVRIATTGLLILTMLVGCASIIGKSGPETLNIRSNPDQADVMITDEKGTQIFAGKTPTTVALEKKKGYFSGKKYNIKISKDACNAQTVTVDTKVNGWYLGGNLIFGGLIGWLIVDPATGAMWTLDSNEVNVTLEKAQQTKIDSLQLGVALLDDVPISLRYNMVKVTP